MNDAIFLPISKVIASRRPEWTFIIEDNIVRIQTSQFVVDWGIIDEILTNKDYKVEEVCMHSALGQVITIRYVGGV